jgi:hypothetical protein
MKKHFYPIVLLLTLCSFGAWAQTELSLTAITPVSNQHYANFSNNDTMHIQVALKNLGPDSLKNVDSIIVWLDLDWAIAQPGFIWYSSYIATDLNCRLAGGIDTIDLSLVQGANIGTDDSGNPLIVALPSNTTEDSIIMKTYGINTMTDSLLVDSGAAFDDEGNLNITGNNLVNPTGVVFGTPTSIRNVSLSKTTLNVFPNPANEKISLSYKFTTSTEAYVKITDIAGRIVKVIELGKQNTGQKIFDINIAQLNNGMYFIELTTDTDSGISKFMKN